MKKRHLRAVLLLFGIAGIAAYWFYPDKENIDCLEENIVFKCNLTTEDEHCGNNFSFSGNWSLMDSLTLEIESSANLKEVIVQVETAIAPAFKELKLNAGKNRYSLDLEHLYTPDYLFKEKNIENTHNSKRFYSVKEISIYTGWKNPANEDLELKTTSICTIGASNVPFVILILYLGILIAIAISVRIRG